MLGTVKVILFVVTLTGFTGNNLFVSGSSNPLDIMLPLILKCAHQVYQDGPDEIRQQIGMGPGVECQKNEQFDNLQEALIYVVDVVAQRLKDSDDTGQTIETFFKKCKNKQFLRSIIVKVTPKLIAYYGHKFVFTVILKAATHPLGVAGDFAQLTLEVFGYENEAKIVGAFGNVVGGGLAGFGVGGPFGAVAGAVAGAVTGLSVWGIGEYVDRCYLEKIESVIN